MYGLSFGLKFSKVIFYFIIFFFPKWKKRFVNYKIFDYKLKCYCRTHCYLSKYLFLLFLK